MEQNPLALLDARTLDESDIQEYTFGGRDEDGNATMILPNSEHEWWYFPQMQTNECLVFKQYDNRNGGGCKQCPHISFFDSSAPEDAPGRRSIEVRICCAFRKQIPCSRI